MRASVKDKVELSVSVRELLETLVRVPRTPGGISARVCIARDCLESITPIMSPASDGHLLRISSLRQSFFAVLADKHAVRDENFKRFSSAWKVK